MDAVHSEKLDYKKLDHLIRERDRYALAKYSLTRQWLEDFVPPGKLLFNIGCGSGEFNQIAVEMGFTVKGFEPEDQAYNSALSHCPPNCSIFQADLLSIDPAESDHADVIVMHDVLEHIEDDDLGVRHLAMLLKKDGRAIISVPALPSLFGYHDEQLGHYRRYTKKSLRTRLSTSFKIRKLRYFGMSFIPATIWYSKWRRRPYPIPVGNPNKLIDFLWRSLCDIELKIPLPLGTSVLAEAEPRDFQRSGT